MLGCGQTTTVSTQELSVAARICFITFSQWTYSCASFLVANWILVIGNIKPTECSSTGVQEIKNNPPPGSVQAATEPPPGSGTRDKASTREYSTGCKTLPREYQQGNNLQHGSIKPREVLLYGSAKKVLKRLRKHTHTHKKLSAPADRKIQANVLQKTTLVLCLSRYALSLGLRRRSSPGDACD